MAGIYSSSEVPEKLKLVLQFAHLFIHTVEFIEGFLPQTVLTTRFAILCGRIV